LFARMWLKRSFRLPLPASPSSTNEVETVHPQVVGAARISPDPLLSGKEAFPLFSYPHSLQPIKSARNSPQNCSNARQFLVESARNAQEAALTRRGFSPRARETPEKLLLLTAVFRRESASDISAGLAFLQRFTLVMCLFSAGKS
jgi:hypothetical protein